MSATNGRKVGEVGMKGQDEIKKALSLCPGDSLECEQDGCPYLDIRLCVPELHIDALELLKEQEAVVHPEPSCEMTYITDCCCDLCGVQLIREDNFCRCCGKPIVWEGR